MNNKRFAITVSLGLALVLTLIWIPSSPFDPARAYTDTPIAPAPTNGTTSYIYLPVTLANFWAGYFDDFSDPNSGWVSKDSDYWTLGYINGEYQIMLKNPQGMGVVSPDLILPADYSIEVDARQANSNISSYGLMFGIQWGEGTYEGYQIIVYPSTQDYLLNKRNMDGSWTLLKDWTYSSAIHHGMGTNHFRVDRIGTSIDLTINNTYVTTITDSSFTSPGRDAGVRAYSYDSAPVDIRFDNFSASLP